MKRVGVPRYGGPEVLSLLEEDGPSPGPQVRVRTLIHRAAKAQLREAVLYRGAARRVGGALLQLAKPADLRVHGTTSLS